jgi:methionine biosynthesis protein MetW
LVRDSLTRYMHAVFAASELANQRAIVDIAHRLGRGGRLLDLGCHDGAFTIALKDATGASEVHGVDLLAEHAQKAEARGIAVLVSDLNEGLPYPDCHFDLVHSNQVIEHLARTDTLLKEAHRLLRSGGHAVISTNNLASWHNIGSLVLGFQPLPSHVSDETHLGNPLDPLRGQPHLDHGRTHRRIFTARSLQELGEYHGLRLEHMAVSGYYPLRPRPARIAARLDPLHAAFITAVFAKA